jgi:hypothetical protein
VGSTEDDFVRDGDGATERHQCYGLSPAALVKNLSPLEPNVTPASLAWLLLQTLSNLSFVITKFGGVTSTARTSVFPQLRRLFYSALDVLSTNQPASEKFVITLCQTGKQNSTSMKSSKDDGEREDGVLTGMH